MYRDIPGFELYEMNENKEIRHKHTKRVKSRHRGGPMVRLYLDGKEVTRKIDKLFDLAFPELCEGIQLPGLSKYKIRKDGTIYSITEAKPLVPASTKDGYLQVSLVKDSGKATSFLVHRLVAMAYLPEMEGKGCVNHIDGDKANNRLENLEWCNHSENLEHAVGTGLYTNKMRECMASNDGATWVYFKSFADMAEELGGLKSNYRDAAVKNSERTHNGGVSTVIRPFTAYGYIVKYVDESTRVNYNTKQPKVRI